MYPYGIFIFGFTTDSFHPKFMINAMTLILIYILYFSMDADVPRSTFYGVYISQLIRFAGMSRHTDFNPRTKILTAKLLQQGMDDLLYPSCRLKADIFHTIS